MLSKDEVQELVDAGVTIQPMQWVETDKNETLRYVHPELPMKCKARLVAMGNFSRKFGRTDSPTADNEGVLMVISFAASRKLKINSGDLEDAVEEMTEDCERMSLPKEDENVRKLIDPKLPTQDEVDRHYWN